MGEDFAFLLWDAEKFYDNIDLTVLLEASTACGLDRRELILSLRVLIAPREIRIGKGSGVAVAPHNGMLAGLRRSNFFARLLLFRTLEVMHKVIPRAGPRQYVDDLAQLVIGDRDQVVSFASTGGWMLIEALRRLRVVISTNL